MTKLTRHNGRSGKAGVFSSKHNDRRFDTEKADHIDQDRLTHNIYWDCYQEYQIPFKDDISGNHSFEEVEKKFYRDQYLDYCLEQHRRNEKTGHSERDRWPEDLRLNKKTCPEETILQIGNIDDKIPADVLADIAMEFFIEFTKRYGEHVHILNWALHMDEGTPHIHERHVFDCENQYGEIMPQQEKALEALGFELPFPDKPMGKKNNRKMVFDKECRQLLFEICEKHGLHLDHEAEFGQKKHLEKNDFIIAKQEEKLEALTLRIEDTEKFIDEVTDAAFDSAVKVVKDKVIEETHNADFDMIAKVQKNLLAHEDYSPKKKALIKNAINCVLKSFKGMSAHITERLNKIFGDPVQKEKMKEPVKKSLRSLLAEKKKEADALNADRTSPAKKKQHDIGL